MSLVKLNRKKILSDLGVKGLTSQETTKVWGLMESIFQARLLDEILSQLSEDDKNAFLAKLTKGKEKQAKDFLKKKIVGYDSFIADIVEQIKKELAEDVMTSKN